MVPSLHVPNVTGTGNHPVPVRRRDEDNVVRFSGTHAARRRALPLGCAALGSALLLSACGSDQNSTGSAGDVRGSASPVQAGDIDCGGSGTLLGAGSSAQQNAMDQWVKDYQAACPDVRVNYGSVGSSGGRQTFLSGKANFAGSDAAMPADEVARSKKTCHGGKAVNLPMVGGPIALAFHVEGVDTLTLDARTTARIFNGKITMWDDPALRKLNPHADLPHTRIQAFHRSDGSGTTANFTEYLKAASGGAWKHKPGDTWPTKGGQSAKGSAGIASSVQQAPGSIGYVELSYATNSQLDVARVDTGAGKPVPAGTDNAAKAVAQARVAGTEGDLALQLNYATKQPGAYPIVLVTYEIVCDRGTDEKKLPALKSFLNYTVSAPAQQSISTLGYLPLPKKISQRVSEQIDKLS